MIAAITHHQASALGWCSGIMTLWLVAVITHLLWQVGLIMRNYRPGPDVPPLVVGAGVGILPAVCVGIVVGFFA